MILLADRRRAAGHQQVAASGRFSDEARKLAAVIRRDAEIDDLERRLRAEKSRQHRPVGVVDHAGRERPTRPHQFVAGRHQADHDAAAHGNLGHASRRQDRDMTRVEPHARRHDDVAHCDILAAAADVGAGLKFGPERDAVALPFDPLLHRDRDRAGRHGRARHDAGGLAGLQRLAHAAGARCKPAAHHVVALKRGERVAVHGRMIEWRQRRRADDVLGGNATRKAREGQGLGADRPLDERSRERLRLLDRQQRLALLWRVARVGPQR